MRHPASTWISPVEPDRIPPGDAYTGDAMPDSDANKHEHGGLDQSALAHVMGYNLAQADIPARKIFFKNIGQPLKLRPVEFTILLLLMSNKDVTQKQLCQTLAVTAPNVTILLDRMQERGLVTRVRNETDRRSQHILLTEEGSALARKAHETSLTMENEPLRHLSPAERAMLIELLQKVARHRRV